MNLTTVAPGAEMVVRHFGESLFFAAHLPETKERISVLDVGSGAGFPGIPMAVLKPSWEIALVESNQRKAVFLREATRSLSNVSVIAERVELIDREVDWVVARAVESHELLTNLPRLAPNVGLMLSESDFLAIRSQFPIAWTEPVRLPWGDRKICAYGRST
jgi:16S rRNA (guanine527-N7)-methyltransferase